MATKILLIDDETDLLITTALRLQTAGYEVSQASNGEDGLRLMRAEKPDLVLLDLLMPGMNGYEVCRQAKADPAIQNIPIIFFTALSLTGTSIANKAKEYGAAGYIIKPFTDEELLNTIREIIPA